MKNKRFYIYKWILLVIMLISSIFTITANYLVHGSSFQESETIFINETPQDTLKIKARYPVSKTIPETYEDINKKYPADLKNPANVNTSIKYDINTGFYVIQTLLGEKEINTPITLTPQQYMTYSFQQSVQSYFRAKNQEAYDKEKEKSIDLTNMQFGIGPAERIFGKGGLRLRTQGSAELKLGLKNNKTDNPSLPINSRSRTFFNFEENVQLNVKASVGSKVNFDMNYNTESSFDFDSRKLKLAYTGEEDEIIKNIEAGNVSMNTSNSLISGGAALFGIKANLQFGKLHVNTILAQQESESKTIRSKGGAQTKDFEITVDAYDENRHFFLSHYFRDNYNTAMAKLPFISSSVTINRIEVWVTNKRNNYDNTRNIVAFSDLAEHKHIFNNNYTPIGNTALPYNGTNTFYQTITSNFPDVRNINQVTQALSGTLEGGREYEKIESARKLDPSEYTYNKQLGYVSLKSRLQTDEVLAVAFQYTSNGTIYQVGEFSTDNNENTNQCLYLKLLKGTSMTPNMPFWDLMMKNIYSLDAYSVQKEKFKLNILYQSDTTGVYVNYLSEGNIKNKILLKVMNLDRLDNKNETYPDGIFDFVDGYTILSENGRVIFPVVEPFGNHLRQQIGNNIIADKYVFDELYDSTLTYAKQVAEKNKFIMRGEFKASSANEIDLGATNVARGSVKVTAGGVVLTENIDYTVDYVSGRVTILNENVISSGSQISVSLENQSTYSMQRKTLMGLDLNYEFNKNFVLGGTIMHLSEMPTTTKTVMGEESIKNTLWGLNASYKTESQWLTNMLDKLPLLSLTQPSQISFEAEFANLIAGHYENKYTGGESYIDDFESTQSGFDLLNPYAWNLSSVPYDDAATALFPEASLVNNIEYGKNRSLLAWYIIDGLFTRSNSSLVPKYIKQDKDQLSDHRVRAVRTDELFPNKELDYNENNLLQILNLSFYPKERGPYNLDTENLNPDGTFSNPEKRFGGIMRRIEQSDFETANIEYIEFWIMDPFINQSMADGGDLYFNLGDVSEDILKDEKKYFENGLPLDGDLTKTTNTVWGKVPKTQSTVYAFDNTQGARNKQDVGLNGLTSEEEKAYPAYVEFLTKLQSKLSPQTLAVMTNDPFSPINDPASDNFHFYRGTDYDNDQKTILERYKHYNGTEGNSTASEDSPERYDISAKSIPDVEDLNQDNTLNEHEKYYQYHISMRPKDLQVGFNFVTDKRTANVKLANGTTEEVNWYQFKIPIKEYQKVVGSIKDFKSIRFMRMFLTGFKDMTVLRFGSFELVRGEWRTYTKDLSNPNMTPTINGKLEVSSVNIEENGDRKPVNYVLPPGVSRMLDPSQPQLKQQNEQALSLKVTNLAPLDARAVYKTTFYDMRQYKKMQLFTHAEKLINDATELKDGELAVFIRLGSDYKNNYYEYEVPLHLTNPGQYSSNSSSDQSKVWPSQNYLNFALSVFTNLKLARNKAKREGQDVTYQTPYSDYDPNNTMNKVTIVGNPSLSEVKTIMVGVRNNSRQIKSGEVWINELRLTDFNEEGGWAAKANMNVQLSDLGYVNMGGHIETAGFGALDQSVSERRTEDLKQYNVATNIEIGKFFPEKAKVSIPFYYAYSNETITPEYNPLDQDIKMEDALESMETSLEKDSIKRLSEEKNTIKSIAFNNVKVDIKSKNPMPYDPANFNLGYSFSETNRYNPETTYETTKDYRGFLGYNYTPYMKPFRPFQKIKKNNGYTKWLKQLSINLLPSNISFQTTMNRNYYEIQLRNLTSDMQNSNIPVSFSQNFIWDRAFSLRWDLTNNLKLNFTSGTNARIEEPHVQVNKELNPDEYKVWKDEVMQSIADLGKPMKYDQTFTANFTLPTQYIPALNFINGSLDYTTQYNWDRGATIDETIEVGNIIKNQRQITFQSGFNLVSLYNKNNYLKRINSKYNSNARRSNVKKKKRPIVKKEIELKPDTSIIVEHGLFSKKIRVSAHDMNGKVYRLEYKPINMAQIEIYTRDTSHLNIRITTGEKPINEIKSKALEFSARFMMMLRRVNIQYSASNGMMLPGFAPEIGDVFGQSRTSYGLSPGLAFAFGSTDRDYIDQAAERNWLIRNENNVIPAQINSSKTLNIKANFEPIKGLKIDLNATRIDSRNTEVQFMYDGMPEINGGSFTMTTIALKSAFKDKGTIINGYKSSTFDQFLNNRQIIANRLENKYLQTQYPNKGFLQNSLLAGQPYNPQTGSINLNQTDVLIPAFLSAYTGSNAQNSSLSIFPTLASLLPNWRITYDKLIEIPFFKSHLKNITLNHQYRCTYNVGNFSSFLSWVDAGQDGLGYIRDIQTGNPTPSSPYDISAVSINETFNPLLGANATLLNNITLHSEYRTTRNLNLNISSYQLIEALSNEFIIGLGYKLTEFNKILGVRSKNKFNNDLTIRLDYSYRKMQSIIRKIENNISQATSGNVAKTLQFSADYNLSQALTLRAFYDLQINNPIISSASYPTSNSNYGVSLRFSLAQ